MNSIAKYIEETPERMRLILKKSPAIFSEVAKIKFSRIILTGSGSSYHAALQLRGTMRELLKIEVFVYYPFMINENSFIKDNSSTLFVGISQGGASYSTYEAMKIAKQKGCVVASMAGMKDAFIDGIANYILTVLCGPEEAGPKTKGYTCTKLNLLLLALSLALKQNNITAAQFDQWLEQIAIEIAQIKENIIHSNQWIDQHAEAWKNSQEIRFIGSKELYGDTLEGALKCLETLRIPVSGYEFDEFIHGVYNAINKDSTIIFLDTGEEKKRSNLQEILSEWTDKIYTISNRSENTGSDLLLSSSRTKFFPSFQFILPIQWICAKIPELKGINAVVPKDPAFHTKMESKKITVF